MAGFLFWSMVDSPWTMDLFLEGEFTKGGS